MEELQPSASSEFLAKTDLKVDKSAQAKLGLAFLGTNRNVGHLSWQTSAKSGQIRHNGWL